MPEAQYPKGPEAIIGVGNEDELVVGVAHRVHRRPGQRLRHVVGAECEIKSMLPLGRRPDGSSRKRGQGEPRGCCSQNEPPALIYAGRELRAEAGDMVTEEGGCRRERVGLDQRRGRVHRDWGGR